MGKSCLSWRRSARRKRAAEAAWRAEDTERRAARERLVDAARTHGSDQSAYAQGVPSSERAPAMSSYGARATAQWIRRVQFRRSWWSGVDGAEVRGFLRQIADESEAAMRELAVVREENARLKAALRDWQSAVGVARVPR